MLKWLLLWPLALCGYTESVSFSEALKEVSPGTLVVLDIDDTLIRYPSHLGSTAWFEEACHRENFHRIGGLLAQKLHVVPIEGEIPEIVRSLQERGIGVMGITRRALGHPGCPHWPQKTADQVASIGVELSGILITDGREKGKVLLSYLQGLERPPKRVLFVDDRKSEVEEVEATLFPHYPVTCIWYRYQELRGPIYNAKVAAEELALIFRELESDIAAEDKDPR